MPPLPAAPSTSALFSQDSYSLLEHIDKQFYLDPDALINLANAFLQEARLGLANYGRPMAMMFVLLSSFSCTSLTILSPSFVTGVPDGTETG